MSLGNPLVGCVAGTFFAVVLLLERFAAARRRSAFIRYSDLAFMTGALSSARWLECVVPAVAWLGALLCTCALADLRVTEIRSASQSIVLCIDTSGSMAQEDIAPTRARAVGRGVSAFLRETHRTRIGLIAFAGTARVLALPSRDPASIMQALAHRAAPQGATAIGDALHLAQSILPQSGVRAVILLTDGVSNTGSDPLAAARGLARRGIRLMTVGIAASDDIQGERALQRAAAAAGGTYVEADSANAIEHALLMANRRGMDRARTWRDLGVPLAAVGEALLTLAFVLRGALG